MEQGLELFYKILKKEIEIPVLSHEERLEKEVQQYNDSVGNEPDYDCPKCKNRGNFMVIQNSTTAISFCKCHKIRNTIKRMKKSGLKGLVNYTFDKYKATEKWQITALNKAQEFLKDSNGKWFFMGGQVGSGKTHLCSALALELMKTKRARYMMWRDDIVKLKATVMKDDYFNLIDEYKNVELLYIDDLFKVQAGQKPTAAEVNIVFELLNNRYVNSDLITIISCELSVDEIIEIDEAVGSRIAEKTRDYYIYLEKDINKNYRLK